MTESFTLDEVKVKIAGAEISADMADDLLEIVVDTTLHMPTMVTILLHDRVYDDDTTHWADDSTLDVGKEVEILVGTTSLMKGELTALEPSFADKGVATLLLRGYDKSHRLHMGRKTRTFLSTKDSDLASTIAGEAGLSPQVDATTVTYDWVLQNNQTNMEFLLDRAQRNGYQVTVSDGQLYFKKGDSNQGAGPELKWGANLRTFRPRLTTSHQAKTVKVRGWDAKAKATLESSATQSLTAAGVSETGGAKAETAFVAAEEIVVGHPVATVDEASALATGLSHDVSREFIQAEGLCFGHPDIKAGKTLTVAGVGSRFGGTYFVTVATHVINFSGKGSYETRFEISGRQPNTLHHLLDARSGQSTGPGLGMGVVSGQVTNIDDPDDLGRVKVKYAWLGSDPLIESHWVRIATPMAGPQRGFMCLPEVNDEVLVAFEHGDVHHPYILGALWSSTDKPPKPKSEAIADGKVNQRVMKTRAGHLIVLDDKQGEEQVSVTSKSGHTVILDDKSGSEKITIKDKTGNNSMIIDSASNSMAIAVNGDFTVTAKGKVEINSTAAMTIKSSAAMTLEATGNAKLKGAQLAMEGVSKGELKAPMVDINGSGQTAVKSSGILQIQGSLVKIN
jgi:phage protein D/phage baseplate assembly protein gpV